LSDPFLARRRVEQEPEEKRLLIQHRTTCLQQSDPKEIGETLFNPRRGNGLIKGEAV
jgi:hypothetical protein